MDSIRKFRIPRVGDEWEFQFPGKPKRRKIVGEIYFEWHQGDWNPETCRHARKRLPRVYWKRLPKGRYTSMRVKWLLKNGRLLSTEQQRQDKFNARMEALDRSAPAPKDA